MSILNKKSEIFGNIGAMNALSDKLPKGFTNNSISSISNSENSTDFLVDLVINLKGFKELKKYLINTITYSIDEVELDIKEALKTELNSLISCDLNPSIPDWLKSTGSGFEVRIKDFDFFDIFKVDPITVEGKLLFGDTAPSINSTDFNTFLFYTIQASGNQTSWGQATTNQDIFNFEFKQNGTTENNVIKVNSSNVYDNRPLNSLNNDFIDSISLFGGKNTLNSATIIALLIEEIFGTISSTKKSRKQIKKEVEIGELIECFINIDNDVVDDSFFEFNNPTLSKISEIVGNKKNGVVKLETCGNVEVSITAEDINDEIVGILNSQDKSEELIKVTSLINNLENLQGSQVPNGKDKSTAGNNFIVNMIKKIAKVLASSIISPKLMLIILINNKIIYGVDTKYTNVKDFLKRFKKIFKQIIKTILNKILLLLMDLAIKFLVLKLQEKIQGDKAENVKAYSKIVQSYLGGASALSGIANCI